MYNEDCLIHSSFHPSPRPNLCLCGPCGTGGCFKGQIGMKGDKRQVINTVMERNQQFFERYIKQQMLSVKNTQKIQERRPQANSKQNHSFETKFQLKPSRSLGNSKK